MILQFSDKEQFIFHLGTIHFSISCSEKFLEIFSYVFFPIFLYLRIFYFYSLMISLMQGGEHLVHDPYNAHKITWSGPAMAKNVVLAI